MQLRILVVGPTPPPFHGVATFTRDLLNAGANGEYGDGLPPVQWLHLDTSDRRDASNLGRWDARNIQLGISNLAELAARCMRSRIDIVYIPISQSVPAFLRDGLFILQARLLGARVVVHLHGGYFRQMYDGEAGALARMFIRLALRRASAAIVLAPEFQPLFAGLIDAARVHVVENGVPDPGAWALREMKSAASEAPDNILYIGTLTRTKGILELLQAFAELRIQRASAVLNVAGEWADERFKNEALNFVREQRLETQIVFHGNVDGAAKARLLADAGLLCLPTRYLYEGQPLVILEAFAAGVPVLSTRHAAIASTVTEGQTGWLIEKDATPAELREKLDSILGDQETLASCGRRARQTYLEKYTLQACHQRLIDVFYSSRKSS